ncbi:MAG TPA: hypothetical protein VKM94_15460 [Blastocatellia bacterium]|nr:hypothetical protein [Blastocatellia bacterium]
MARTLTICCVVLFWTALPCSAQNADEIALKIAAARGGLGQLRAIKTMVVHGKLVGPGVNASILVRLKRNNQIRIELDFGGRVLIQGFDGSVGWQINPFSENPAPQQLSGAELLTLRDQADIDGVVVNYKDKGHKLELMGKQQVDGKDCFKLKLTLNTGNLMYLYIDAATFLEIREELVHEGPNGMVEIEEAVGGYKRFGGLLFATEFDSNSKGSSAHHKLTIEKIDLNADIDESIFKMPKGK